MGNEDGHKQGNQGHKPDDQYYDQGGNYIRDMNRGMNAPMQDQQSILFLLQQINLYR